MKKRRNTNRHNLITGIAVSICLGFMLNAGNRIEKIKVDQKERFKELRDDVDSLREEVQSLESTITFIKMKALESEDLIDHAMAPLAQNREEFNEFLSDVMELSINFQKAANLLHDRLSKQGATLVGELQMIESTLSKAVENLESINP